MFEDRDRLTRMLDSWADGCKHAMKRGLGVLLALAAFGTATGASGDVAASWHAYYLFLAGVPTGCEDCYVPLLVARSTLEEVAANVYWVHNVRAAGGRAVLRSGGREEIQLEEVPTDQRAPILRAYLQRAPGARPHVPVNKDAALAEFEKIAAAFPVFRVASNKAVQPTQNIPR